jgi:protein gp37
MAENSGISWTHNTQNFWVGCDKVSPECAKCYIGRILQRHPDKWPEPWGELYRTSDPLWSEPWKWEADCIRNRCAKRIFTCSLSDFFHVKADPWRREAWAIIKRTPHLVWLVLTKRPELIEARLPRDWGDGYSNVWLGVSTGCRQTLNKMDKLRNIPAAVRWVSAEPLLEDISQEINLDGFHWVVVGGESGNTGWEHKKPGPFSGWGRRFGEYQWDPNANWKEELKDPEIGRRTTKYPWVTAVRDKVKAAGLPFMFKQVTAPRSGFGYNALDGKDWHEFPHAPNELQWAPRQEIPGKCKMTTNQIYAFTSGETYPFKLATVKTITRRWHPPLPSQRVFPELVPALLISLGVHSKEAVTDFIKKYGEGLTSEEIDRLNGWITVLHNELLNKAKALKGSPQDTSEVGDEPAMTVNDEQRVQIGEATE